MSRERRADAPAEDTLDLLDRIYEKEEAAIAVYEIREELLDRVMKEIGRKYMDHQLIKFVVHCVIEAFKKMLNVNFYNHSTMFWSDPNPNWCQDEQGPSSKPDSWAAYRTPIRNEYDVDEREETLTEESEAVTSGVDYKSEVHFADSDAKKTSEHSTQDKLIYERSPTSIEDYLLEGSVTSSLSIAEVSIESGPSVFTRTFLGESLDALCHEKSVDTRIYSSADDAGYPKVKPVKNTRRKSMMMSSDATAGTGTAQFAMPPFRSDAKLKSVETAEQEPKGGKATKRSFSVIHTQ